MECDDGMQEQRIRVVSFLPGGASHHLSVGESGRFGGRVIYPGKMKPTLSSVGVLIASNKIYEKYFQAKKRDHFQWESVTLQ